jgi:hypothetical protein
MIASQFICATFRQISSVDGFQIREATKFHDGPYSVVEASSVGLKLLVAARRIILLMSTITISRLSASAFFTFTLA